MKVFIRIGVLVPEMSNNYSLVGLDKYIHENNKSWL